MQNKDLSMPESTHGLNFKALFENAPDPYLVLSPTLHIIGASHAYLKATLVQRESAIGRHLFDVFPDNPDDPNATGTSHLSASLQRVLQNKKTDIMAIQKYDIRRPESEGGGFEERHWAPSNHPVFNSAGEIEAIIHKAEDVTEFIRLKQERVEQHKLNLELLDQREQQDKVRQAQKLEAMGQLAGGVAHDFNNFLGIVMLSCEELLARQNVSEEVRTEIDRIHKSAKSAADLTRGLLAFSRNQVLQPKAVEVNQAVSQLHALLKRLLPENVRLTTALGANPSTVIIDHGQLDQIVMNLVVNARDAMPSGGTISVDTENVTLEKPLSTGHFKVEPGKYVLISVRDTGVGMDAATQARLFEPFFTTKPVGKGTGLGLATVHGIVSQNKGTIWVYSELGRGTVFKIYLPSTEQSVEQAVSPLVRKAVDVSGLDPILVVEDQDPLRKIIVSVLQGHGYKVFEAENGVEALKFLNGYSGKLSLLVSDVIMPEMGGMELSERVLRTRPGLPILFLSGYTDDVLPALGSTVAKTFFLEKPFGIQALITKVAEALALTVK